MANLNIGHSLHICHPTHLSIERLQTPLVTKHPSQ